MDAWVAILHFQMNLIILNASVFTGHNIEREDCHKKQFQFLDHVIQSRMWSDRKYHRNRDCLLSSDMISQWEASTESCDQAAANQRGAMLRRRSIIHNQPSSLHHRTDSDEAQDWPNSDSYQHADSTLMPANLFSQALLLCPEEC